MIRILFICHGNICRSTMAESYFTHIVRQNGLSEFFAIDSAATSREELGNPPHRGTVRKLKENGIPTVPHRARRMTREDAIRSDLIIGMDDENIYYINRITGKAGEGKTYKLFEFVPRYMESGEPASKGQSAGMRIPNVPDPWYTGDFDETYRYVSRGCEGLLSYCIRKYDLPAKTL